MTRACAVIALVGSTLLIPAPASPATWARPGPVVTVHADLSISVTPCRWFTMSFCTHRIQAGQAEPYGRELREALSELYRHYRDPPALTVAADPSTPWGRAVEVVGGVRNDPWNTIQVVFLARHRPKRTGGAP